MKKTLICGLLAATTAIGACSKRAEDITPTMVGTAQYSHLNCNQIIRERNRVVTSVNDLTGRQNKAATNDAVAMGVGLVLFWPALFAVGFSEDLAPQLAQMKGQYEALTQIGIERNCFDV